MSTKLSVNINGKLRQIPLGWDQVSISTYQDVSSLHEQKLPEEDANRLLVCSLLDVELEDLMALTPKEFSEIMGFLSFATTSPEVNPKDTIVVDGVKYGFVDITKMTLGEFVDLDKAVTENAILNLHVITAILYRPITEEKPSTMDRMKNYLFNINRKNKVNIVSPHQVEKYDPVSMRTRAAHFQEHATVADVYGAAVFFCITGMEFTTSIVASLQEEKMTMLREIRERIN